MISLTSANRRFAKFTALAVGLVLVAGCASMKPIDTSTAQGAYELAQRYEHDERYEEALSQYANLKNKFPYSKYATAAELAIADIQFKKESYVEAESSYKLFKEFHPNHPKIAYVTFRLGLSIYNQLPSSIDRDLTLAQKAIMYFDEVARSYANTPYAAQALEYKRKARVMLAQKDYYIAHFYFIRDFYQSALGRFEDLLDKYSGLGLNAKALYGAAMSAAKLKEKDIAQRYYHQLVSLYPTSAEARKAKQELKDEL